MEKFKNFKVGLSNKLENEVAIWNKGPHFPFTLLSRHSYSLSLSQHLLLPPLLGFISKYKNQAKHSFLQFSIFKD
jgi:hypothetical protein